MPTPIQPPEQSNALLGVREVAAILNCSVRHVFRLTENQRIPPPVRLGALTRWSRRELETWLDSGCPPCNMKGRENARK